MIRIDETFVDAAAPNATAVSNGREILRKGKIVTRHKDEDETIIFGECKGSGASNYVTSVDFRDPSNPVYRCTCPSRQFPCKHSLGLMYAWVRGEPFAVADLPAEIAAKREKARERTEKKKEAAAAPRKVDKKALARKIAAQLAGLDVLETMTHDLIRGGLGTVNARSARLIEEKAKELGNAYLPGAQNALRAFTSLFSAAEGVDDKRAEQHRETIYTEALDRLTRLQMICRRGREYLTARSADPELRPDTDSTIAEWLGHVWQLSELKEYGLYEENTELVQLAFCTCDDVARREFVDLGAWVNLGTGMVGLTKNFRPYKAVKFIREDDCFFRVARVPRLFCYPGDLNARIRWDEASHRDLTPADCAAIREKAAASLAEVIRTVRNQLKDPLADKTPWVLVRYRALGRIGETAVLEDAAGERIALTDTGPAEELPTVHLLSLIDRNLHRDQVMLLRFTADLDSQTLRAKPLTIVTKDQILRLAL